MSCKFLCKCKGTTFFRYIQIFYKDFAILTQNSYRFCDFVRIFSHFNNFLIQGIMSSFAHAALNGLIAQWYINGTWYIIKWYMN